MFGIINLNANLFEIHGMYLIFIYKCKTWTNVEMRKYICGLYITFTNIIRLLFKHISKFEIPKTHKDIQWGSEV